MPHTISGVRSVISTQPAERAAELQKALKGTGLAFYHLPMIRTVTAEMNPDLEKVFARLETFDLLVFTSRNGVRSFFELLRQQGKTLPGKVKTAVIGAGTAKELEQVHRQADFIQPGNTSRDFAVYLKTQVLQGGEKVLLALGNLAPDFLQDELANLAIVGRINVYITLQEENYDRSVLQKALNNAYGLLVFSSPSAFLNFYGIYQKEQSTSPLRIVSIGQITTQAILKHTRAEVFTARKPGTEGLRREIIKYFHLKD
jgi:uroporphyrinogen-III synthase